jgi:hypothetical protein
VRKNHETRIQTAEMKFVLGVAGYTRADQQRNTKIRKEVKVLA